MKADYNSSVVFGISSDLLDVEGIDMYESPAVYHIQQCS